MQQGPGCEMKYRRGWSASSRHPLCRSYVRACDRGGFQTRSCRSNHLPGRTDIRLCGLHISDGQAEYELSVQNRVRKECLPGSIHALEQPLVESITRSVAKANKREMYGRSHSKFR